MADLLGARRRRDPRAVGRPPARLHGIDRPPAPAAPRSRSCTTDIDPDDVLVFAGRGGGDLLPGQRAARAGRPRHRHVARLPEPVRGGARGRRRRDPPRAARGRSGWALDVERLHRRSCGRRRGSSSSTPRTTRRGCCRPTPSGRRLWRSLTRPGHAPPRRRGLPLSSSSTRRTGCPPAPTPCRAGSRSASCRSRSRWRACGSAGWRPATATCWRAARRSRTTRRSAPPRRRRSSR